MRRTGFSGRTPGPAGLTAEPGFAASDIGRVFARFYGRICRNLVLIALARFGLVLTAAWPPAVRP